MAPKHGPGEVFLGNLPVARAASFVAACRAVCPSVRAVPGAMALDGVLLPGHLAVFVARAEEASYSAWRLRGGGSK